jgi:hypothetical protein
MSTPERRELSRKVARETLQALREKNPNHQSEASKKAHRDKDELGRSLLSMRNYPKGIGLRDNDGNLVYGPPDLNNMKYIDPDHPELGVRSPGTLVRMQKSRGYPHGKGNRVKLTNDESRSS